MRLGSDLKVVLKLGFHCSFRFREGSRQLLSFSFLTKSGVLGRVVNGPALLAEEE